MADRECKLLQYAQVYLVARQHWPYRAINISYGIVRSERISLYAALNGDGRYFRRHRKSYADNTRLTKCRCTNYYVNDMRISGS